MLSHPVYLDHASTTPTDPRVGEAMLPYLAGKFGNPSSIHSFGQQAHLGINEAREVAAKALGCGLEEVIFTSGATEANNFIVHGVVGAYCNTPLRGRHIVTSAIEHPSVLEGCRRLEKEGCEVTYLPVDGLGRVSAQTLEGMLREDTVLVSIMAANNEVGTIQPIAEVGKICQERGIFFHTDAVQYYPYFSCKVEELGISSLTLSAHKFGGPKGVGLVYVRKGSPMEAILVGGGQEFHLRSGTQNVPGIVGMGRAMEIVESERRERKEKIERMKGRLIKNLKFKILNFKLNASPENSTPHILNARFPGVAADKLVVRLDLEGFAVSTGSACSNVDSEISHVLLAMGRSGEEARSSIRISIGHQTSDEEIEKFVDTLVALTKQLQGSSDS